LPVLLKIVFFAEEMVFAVWKTMQEHEIYVDTCGEGTTYFLLRKNEWRG
jgi:hypothetical protein